MKQKIMTEIMQGMQALKRIFEASLLEVDIVENNSSCLSDDISENQRKLDLFIAAKRIEGCSEKSLKYYRTTIEAMLEIVGKGIKHITTDDLRSYLTEYQIRKQSSKVTIDNIRRILSSFISFLERECVVFGKGSKERIVYFDARTKIHLQNYLQSRKDDNNALFVALKKPYNRMSTGGIESRLRKMGEKMHITKVHIHKFRRTMAIDKGMPIEQLQRLLGHQRVDTTLQYAMVKQSNVKIAHRKYIG